MSEACAHAPRDIRGKTTCHGRRIYRKQLCRICGWVREYSMPLDSGGVCHFGPWTRPEDFMSQAKLRDPGGG